MKNKIIQPLSAGFCATVLAIAGSVTANVAASAVLPSKAFALASTSNSGESDSSLPPLRTSLTKEEAEQMEGCEAYFDSAKHEFVIRPKNGANEGVISYSIANKKGDFETIRKKLIFDGDSDEVSVRFDKRVYIYDSTNPSANDTLFYQVHVKTINITPNLSIKFAKNLATFFMQNYNKDADHLHYIKGVENWDTSHVESMEKMFNLASQLEGKLDLSKWDVSGADKLNLMFSGVGNDNFVLDFSNKKFKNSVDVTNMFNSFRGVLVANNWTVADPSGDNPIQKLVDNSSWMLTHWDASARKYTGPSWHLLITDNPTILKKNETAKYKFYKKVKVIYKVNGTEKSVELELPAVYDSRIDENGKPDVSKAASSDPMKVIKPQIKEAIQNAIKQLRTENPSLNLPENVIPVPVKEILDSDSPAALFQDYYLGLVTEQVVKAKTTYTADPTLTYQQVVTDTQAVDGKKQVITGKMVNGVWQADATDEKEITKVVNGVARVGNKQVVTEDIQPGTTYEADSSLEYNKTSETAGEAGTKSVTKVYKVNPTSGLTTELDGTPTEAITKAAKNKVVKVGNKQVVTETVEPGTTYEADSSLEYNKTSETVGESGTKSVTKVYKVNKDTGLTTDLDGTPTETTTKAAKNKVIKVGNKQVVTETVEPGVTYEADSSLEYNKTSETAGESGTKSVTKVYKVNPTSGLTTELDGTPTETTTKAAKNKVIKVGNVKTENKVIKFTTEEINDPTLPEGQTQTTEGKDGSEKLVTTYEVNSNTGLTDKVLKTETKDHVDAVKKVVRHGTKKNTPPQPPTPPTPPAPDPNDPHNPSGQGGQGGNTGEGGQGSDQGGHGNDSQGGQGGEGGQGDGTGNTGSGAGDGTHGGLNPDNPYGGHFVDPAWTYNPELNIWEWNGNGTNNHSNDGNGSNSDGSNGANSAADAAGASAGANGSANGSNANANGSNANGVNNANGSGANGSNGANAKNHKLSGTGANASGAVFAFFGSMLLGLLGLFGAASKRRSSKHSNR